MFEARSRPQPLGKVIRTPSIVLTGYRAAKCAAARSTMANFSSSGTSTRISGVAIGAGQVGQQRRETERLPAHDLQQARRGEQRVVEAEVVAAEEHVPAHLARQRRA